ncbi:hypothetical protein [Agrilutibacter solisilvae]|uniref:Uncharacterized protein n=1 Tax=Agrilutibacter solisilvae TaxID=2763317 RepID=A0A975ARJ5_9GAMM|nr:hypothetical protein [Lysobacter solisilvae]QSX77944.1 hypothetical protein I8J32_014635 [Lysobacter solisilvae]
MLLGLATGCQRNAPTSANNASDATPESQPQVPAPDAQTASPSTTGPVTPDSTPTPPTSRPTGRFAEELRNAVYPIDTTPTGKAPLKDGLYESSVAGSSSRNTVRLGPVPVFGDLDGDNVEDAAVTLLATPGGSGSFSYLSAVLNDDGAARPTAAVLIGDRITVQSMHIVDGRIEVTWLDRKPGEPMSTAPATRVSKTFVVRGGKLVEADDAGTGATAGLEPLRGHYTWGAEVETFRPCGSTQSFWVIGDKVLLQPLRDRSAALAKTRGKPYQPVYIEASGASEGKATDGFAADYDGVYRLAAVQAAKDVSPADCKAR